MKTDLMLLDEQRARHVERMHAIMGDLRTDFDASRERETWARSKRLLRIVRGELTFQADVCRQIVGVHAKLAASAVIHMRHRDELAR